MSTDVDGAHFAALVERLPERNGGSSIAIRQMPDRLTQFDTIHGVLTSLRSIEFFVTFVIVLKWASSDLDQKE